MSFITKRERVFNEYDLLELPSRNEGKLKAYASCTDARAWSHFNSDKTEHLVDLIKRNNEICRPKYIPTAVIIDTLMVAKNAEIGRLKSKIDMFEQMLVAYDELDLTCEQKCEIAGAHAAIKSANKQLNELCLNLDISGFTEGSETFETGRSRGDELSKYKSNRTDLEDGKHGDESSMLQWSDREPTSVSTSDTKSQTNITRKCDVCTLALDPRIEEMQDVIITKDAKLNAMQNTIAVMENDVCEPYCVYAHIYTALEKIFGTLCQNEKYKQYLNLLSSGRDVRNLDIKSKILYKMKILEKFSLALLAPCSQDTNSNDCSCYRVGTTLTFTSELPKKANLDNKRAKLVANIMEQDDLTEILSHESVSVNTDDERNDEIVGIDNYNINEENLNRLKELQADYDELMTFYEDLKHEKNCLQVRCYKYHELESEVECLRCQVREYNMLWNEKEHYRKRSENLDDLKKQYYVLSEETSNLETQLKAESEIKEIKSNKLDKLRNENFVLEKKANEASINFEKEKNILQCKLKETECKLMCQEEQIKSLYAQIDRLLEQDHDKPAIEDTRTSLMLIDENESLKEQIRNLKDALFDIEEEKQQLQNDYQDRLKLINELKMNIEDWKGTYDKALQRNQYLEKYTDTINDDMNRLQIDIKEKTTAIDNLMNVISNKSKEVNKLQSEVERRTNESRALFLQLNEIRQMYDIEVESFENEKREAVNSLQLAKQQSKELLSKQGEMSKSIEEREKNFKIINEKLINAKEINEKLQLNLLSAENKSSALLEQIQKLREENHMAHNKINSLQNENTDYMKDLESSSIEIKLLKDRISELSNQLDIFKEMAGKLSNKNNNLEYELKEKSNELNCAMNSIDLTKKESKELLEKIKKGESERCDYIKLSCDYRELVNRNDDLRKYSENIILENVELKQKSDKVVDLQQQLDNLTKTYDGLLAEKNVLQSDFDNKTDEINNLYNALELKIEENRDLCKQINDLQLQQEASNKNLSLLQNENSVTKVNLDVVKKESLKIGEQLRHYENIQKEYHQLKQTHHQILLENERLHKQLNSQLAHLQRIETENSDLNLQNQNLLKHNEDLETSLINTRKEITGQPIQQNAYADILKEIEMMKQERESNLNKIRKLSGKLDQSENIISDMSEDILARDDKIVTMQNHINELGEEINKLHETLATSVETGEHIKDYSYHKIDQSLRDVKARHSKATHNMKLELEKLQSDNLKLEKQLSATKLKTEESYTDKHKYMSQVIHLQNEREIIITEIKQIEIQNLGDSDLCPDNCDVVHILASLDRIRKCIDIRNSKNNALQKTLLQVQEASQLWLTKADEAKKVVEKEKQKNIIEKEEAIAEKQRMEQQLGDLKEKLERQISGDKVVIKDLEAEILNQNLIIDKIDNSTQNYIAKLKEEMKCLQDMYETSIAKVSDLQQENRKIGEENSNSLEVIEKTKLDLLEKCKEIAIIKKKLDDFTNVTRRNVSAQASPIDHTNTTSQTDNEMLYEMYENIMFDKRRNLDEIKGHDFLSVEKIPDVTIMKTNKTQSDQQKLLPTQAPHPVNEVQILAATVEPTFDFIRNSYQNYKLKQLSEKRLEQCSISSSSDINNIRDFLDTSNISTEDQSDNTSINNTHSKSQILIDIYNKHPINKNSSKFPSNDDIRATNVTKQDPESSQEISDLNTLKNYNANADTTLNKKNDNMSKDLFVIYRESGSNFTYDTHDNKDHSLTKRRQNVVNETVTVHQQPNVPSDNKIIEEYQLKNDISIYQPEEEEDDDSEKPKLEINLPRVETMLEESPSPITTSEGYKRSLDSYIAAMYPSEKIITPSELKVSVSLPTISNYDSKNHQLDKSFENLSDEETTKPVVHEDSEKKGTTNIRNHRDNSSKSMQKKTFRKYDSSVELNSKENEYYNTPISIQDIADKDGRKYISIKDRKETSKKNFKKYNASEIEGSEHSLNNDIKPKNKSKNIKSHINSSTFPNLMEDDITSLTTDNEKDNYTEGNKKYSTDETKRHSTKRNRKLKSLGINKTEHEQVDGSESNHILSRVGADVLIKSSTDIADRSDHKDMSNLENFGLEYILNSFQRETVPQNITKLNAIKTLHKTRSEDRHKYMKIPRKSDSSPSFSVKEYKMVSSTSPSPNSFDYKNNSKIFVDRGVIVRTNESYLLSNYENQIKNLRKALTSIEVDYKKKIEAIKSQYDNNIKCIIKEHNEGVRSIQYLHEETLQDVIKIHENEVENLRALSIEAMRKADKLEKENRILKNKVNDDRSAVLDEESVIIPDVKKRKHKGRSSNTRMLTKTNVEAFNVKPKPRSHGPCTCSLDINISDTIRNIFEQVDVEHRKMAENTYIKYIASKMTNGSVEALDAQELSFLHLKVCRTWKMKLNKEEALKKRIDALENELINKQRNAQQHIAELDRKVAEERRRLQEVREAMCCDSRLSSPTAGPEQDYNCHFPGQSHDDKGLSAGDVITNTVVGTHTKRETNRAVLTKLNVEERPEKKLYNDDPPIRLRRSRERTNIKSKEINKKTTFKY